MMKSCRNSSDAQTLVRNKCRIAPRVIAICGTFALAVSGWIGTSVCLGQNAGTGAIAGTVTDPSDKTVPQAQITVTNEATHATTVVETRSGGTYTVPLLLPGTYAVEVSKQGFKVWVTTGIRVNVTETEGLNIKLELGSVSEKVTVQIQASPLQTESSALGRVTSSEAIQNLPLAVRNYTQIIGLNPGVSTDVTNASQLGRGDDISSVVSGGVPNKDNNIQMDGVQANDRQQSGQFSGGAPVPNPDSIQEFKVQTSQYDASFGRNAGANVNVVTKGGSNKFHGNAWEYFRDTVMNANDFFVKNAVLNQNQFGGALGGPIKKDKLLFFTSYQGTRQKNGQDPVCKTALLGFTGLSDTNRNAAGLGLAFGGQHGVFAGPGPQDTIAADGSNIAAQAIAILNVKVNGKFLIPSMPGASLNISTPCPFTEDQFLTNADYIQSDRSKFSARFFFADDLQTQTFPGRNAVPGDPFNANNTYRYFSLTHEYAFSSRLVNQASIGFHRTFGRSTATSAFSYSSIGATVPSSDNLNASITIPGGFSIPGNVGGGNATILPANSYDGQDSLFYVAGRHFFRFGGGVTYVQENRQIVPGAQLLIPSFADFLLGLCAGQPVPQCSGPNNGSPFSNILAALDSPGQLRSKLRSWDGDAYVQDDFKVTARLTLNLGFRYDRQGYQADALGHNVGFNPNLIVPYSTPASNCTTPFGAGSCLGFTVSSNYPGTLGTAASTGVTKLGNEYGFPGNGQNTWNPRLGFSWQLPRTNNRSVLRGGYGIYHSIVTGAPQLNASFGQPFFILRGLFGPSNGAASWAQPFQPVTGTVPNFVPYTASSTESLTAFDPNFRPPMIQQYSLNVQMEMASDLVFEVGYAGQRGLHVTDSRSINQACVNGAPISLDGCPGSIAQGTNTIGNVQQRVPYEGFSASGLTIIQSQGAYWYNALLASLTKRFSHGLQLQLSYTFAKSLDTFADTTTGINGGAPIADQNHPLYGPDGAIRPHRFVASYIYQLPGPKKPHSLAGIFLGDWQWAGVTTYQSGQFLTLTVQSPANIYGDQSTTASLAAGCSVGQVGTAGSLQSRLNDYFNSACLTPPGVSPLASPEPNPACGGAPPFFNSCPVATGFGNLGVGIVRGPDQANWDMSLGKHFITGWPNEAANVEFRADFFNTFNHTQFANPGTTLQTPSFGQITSTSVNPRIIQLALRFNF
jgi:Carboxypeptidase regulatory-like domain